MLIETIGFILSLLLGVALAAVVMIGYLKVSQRPLFEKMKTHMRTPPMEEHLIFGHFDKQKIPEEQRGSLAKVWFSKMGAEKSLITLQGPNPAVLTRDSELMQQVLVKHDITKFSKGQIYNDLKSWLGNGILMSEGEAWRHKRKLLNHAFSSNALKGMVPIFAKCTDVLLQTLDALPEGAQVDMLDLLTKTTLDVIGLAAFNFNFDSLLHPNDETRAFQTILHEISRRISDYIFLPPWLWLYGTSSGRNYRASVKILHKAAEQIIRKRLNALNEKQLNEEGVEPHKDLLDHMIDACMQEHGDSKKISMELLRDEIMTFLFAGHDTTSTAMTWFILEMSQNPQHLEQVLKEIDTVLPDTLVPSMTDIGKLSYTTMCFKESMRMHAPVPAVGRKTESDIELNGHTIPKGVNFVLHFGATHHNGNVIPNVEQFNPLNFDPNSPQNSVVNANFAPFSLGPRNCIGQQFAMVEARVVLGKLFKRYTFKVLKPEEAWPELGIIAKPHNGLKVSIHRRK